MKPEVLFCLLGSLLLQFSGNTEAVSRQYRVLVHIASAHHTEHLDLTCHNNFDTSTPFAEFTEIVTQETVTNNGKDKVKVVVSQKNYQHRAASTDEPGPSQENQKSTPGVGTTTTKGPANKSPLITLTTTKRPAKPAATTSKAPAATTKIPAATAKPSTADTKQKQMFTTTTKKPARPIKTFTTTTKKLPAATAAAATTKVADKSAILTTKAPAKPAAASTPKSPAKPAAASTTKIPSKPAAASTTKIPANQVTTPAASLVTKKAIPVKPKSISLPPLKPNSVTKKPGQAATKKPPMVPISMKPSIVTQKPKEMLTTTTTKKAAPPTTLQPEKIAVNRFTMSVDVAGLRDLRERAMNDDDDYE